jgi:hypothetical protein
MKISNFSQAEGRRERLRDEDDPMAIKRDAKMTNSSIEALHFSAQRDNS